LRDVERVSKYDLQTIQALDDLELLRFAKFGLGSGFANYKVLGDVSQSSISSKKI